MKMNDLISRQAAIDAVYHHLPYVSRERARIILRDVPSAQPNLQPTCNQLATDCISRQAMIDALVKYVADGYAESPNDFEGYMEVIRELPSAQPEIIRCEDCKHRDPEDKKCDCGHDILWQLPRDDEWYCADAERREDA